MLVTLVSVSQRQLPAGTDPQCPALTLRAPHTCPGHTRPTGKASGWRARRPLRGGQCGRTAHPGCHRLHPGAMSPVVGAILATRCRCCHSSSYIPCFLVPVRLSAPAQVPMFCSPSRFPFRPGHLGTCPFHHRHGAWRLGAQPQVWGLRAGVGARPARRPPARHVASGSVSDGPKGICVKPLTGYREQNDETPCKAPAHA